MQAWVLQGIVSDADPAQGAPPLTGAGLLQRRVRVMVPPPHVRLQFPLVHAPQFPFTAIICALKQGYYKSGL